MKDGICPKCKSVTVYTKRQGISFASDTFFYVSISGEKISRSVREVAHYRLKQ